MSLASQLAEVASEGFVNKKGPEPACRPLYGDNATEEDWRAVEELRLRTSWKFAQETVDQMLEIERPIRLEKFRYHWRRRCSCWPEDVRG